MKTTEEGSGSNGYDTHKNVKGRKRHLLVDTLGLPLSIYVTPADVQDRAGARLLLAGLGPLVPRLKIEVLPKRWIVERTFGWLRRDRRLTKDYERKAQTSGTLIKVAMIRLSYSGG
jgi:putative transposase